MVELNKYLTHKSNIEEVLLMKYNLVMRGRLCWRSENNNDKHDNDLHKRRCHGNAVQYLRSDVNCGVNYMNIISQ